MPPRSMQFGGGGVWKGKRKGRETKKAERSKEKVPVPIDLGSQFYLFIFGVTSGGEQK